MQQNDNTKKTPGSSSSCPCWCDCGWDSSSRPLSIFRFSTYHSHHLSTCSQGPGRMRKVVAMSSSRTSLDIGFSLKMDRKAFVNLNLYVVFYWSSVCKRVVCFSLSYVLSVKLCGKNKRSSMLWPYTAQARGRFFLNKAESLCDLVSLDILRHCEWCCQTSWSWLWGG